MMVSRCLSVRRVWLPELCYTSSPLPPFMLQDGDVADVDDVDVVDYEAGDESRPSQGQRQNHTQSQRAHGGGDTAALDVNGMVRKGLLRQDFRLLAPLESLLVLSDSLRKCGFL